MSYEDLSKSDGHPKNLEEVREMFLNPNDPRAAEKLAELSGMALNTMAMIMAYGGDIGSMPEETRKWLYGEDLGPVKGFEKIQQVVGQVLQMEAGTRRFDNRSMGQIHPQGFIGGIIGHEVAAYTNENTVVREVSKAASFMEDQVMKFTLGLVGFDKEKGSGNIVAGGSTANLLALWVAREQMRKVQKYPGRLAVITTEMGHYSLEKAAWILDMDTEVAATKNYKTDWQAVEEKIQEVRDSGREVASIVALAGETETGLVDDLNKAADVAERNNVRLHVDAAYGGPFIMSRAGKLFAGINRADSITMDPHKYLYVPYEAGIAMFGDRTDHALVQNGARYLQEITNKGLLGDPSKRNLGLAARVEGSMGAAGAIATYIAIESLGTSGYETLLNHTLDMVNAAYEATSESEILAPVHIPELNTLLVTVRPEVCPECHVNGVVRQVKESLDKKEKGYYVSDNEEVCNGHDVFRVVPTHPYTTKDDILGLVKQLEVEVKTAMENISTEA